MKIIKPKPNKTTLSSLNIGDTFETFSGDIYQKLGLNNWPKMDRFLTSEHPDMIIVASLDTGTLYIMSKNHEVKKLETELKVLSNEM